VKEKALGQDVYNKVNPSQMIVKIVHDEIQELLGDEQEGIAFRYGEPVEYTALFAQSPSSPPVATTTPAASTSVAHASSRSLYSTDNTLPLSIQRNA